MIRRGDQPCFDFSQNVFRYASELIAHIRTRADFCIAAAAYVEGHVDARRVSEDLVHLREKVSAGVDFLVTQLFFDNRQFHDFMERIRAMGIHVPVTAGIMPVLKAEQIKRIASLAGASLPAGLVLMMDKYGDQPEEMRKSRCGICRCADSGSSGQRSGRCACAHHEPAGGNRADTPAGRTVAEAVKRIVFPDPMQCLQIDKNNFV